MENSERTNTCQIKIEEKNPESQMFPNQTKNIQQVPIQQNVPIKVNQQPYANNAVYIYPQNGAQPAIVGPINPNYIVVNQVSPMPTISVGRFPASRVCPFCGLNVKTEVEESFNCLTYTTYLLCSIFLFLAICYGGCNCSGDCNCNCGCCGNCNCCYDAIHYCPNCKRVIGEYDSCREKFGCKCFDF